MTDPQTPATDRPCDARYGRKWCTLMLGHEGKHIAHGPGGVILAAWANRGPKR